MALRTILLRKRLSEKEKARDELRSRLAGFKTREDELSSAIEEAKTDEEIAAVEAAVEELENSQKSTKEALEAVKKEIEDILKSIEEAEAAQEEAINESSESDAGDDAGDNEDGEARSASRRRETRSMYTRMNLREAQDFQRTGKHSYKDVRSFLRSTVLTSSTGVVGPTGVSGINDAVGNGVSGFIDLIKPVDCTGMSSYKFAYMTADAADAAAITEGQAPTEGEPGFGSGEITPTNYGTIGYVSKEIRKQTPLNYEEKVTDSARRSLRRKLSKVAVDAVLASSINDSLALVGSTTAGADLIDASLLSNIILAYGGDEEIEGAGTLVLAKDDLKAFAAVRGTNEYLPVYSIVPDANNPSTGIIKDNNGLSCRYCLNKNVTALSTATLTTTAKKTMFYGNPQCCELALWGDFDVEVNDGYKFGEGLLTIRGEVTGGADVTVKNGFVVVTAKKSA